MRTFLLLKDELFHELLLFRLHLGQSSVLCVQTIKLSFLLNNQSSELLLLSLSLLSVRLQQVPSSDSLNLLLLNLLGHCVKDDDETICNLLEVSDISEKILTNLFQFLSLKYFK